MISHTYAFIVLYVCVAPCGMYVKNACFLVRDKTLCAQIYCKNDVADYKKEIHGYKKVGIIFYSIYNSVSLPCFPC